ncbi:MAG: enoyl-CoA hydratase/isomerase family protein [Candidatus Thorarchaeota archaeon]
MEKNILVEYTDKIAIIYFNRPDLYNAFNYDLFVDLGNELTLLSKRNDLIGIILTGKGKAFSGGGDLKSVASFPDGISSAFYRLVPQLNRCVIEIMSMSIPVVAAINGIAAGGGFSICLTCDFRFMAKSAKLKQAYTSSGLSIDGAGTLTLPRLVGYSKALEIATFDDIITSEQAINWGLVTKVVDDNNLISESVDFIKKIALKSLNSFAWSKKLFQMSYANNLERQLELEREGIVSCSYHPDGQEGIRAFLEKRSPIFNKVEK